MCNEVAPVTMCNEVGPVMVCSDGREWRGPRGSLGVRLRLRSVGGFLRARKFYARSGVRLIYSRRSAANVPNGRYKSCYTSLE